MATEYKRTDRLNSLIHSEIAQLLERDFKIPSIGMITITGAKVSPDLSIATIYFTLHDEAKLKAAKDFLVEITGELRFQLGKRIKVRKMPQLRFIYDESISRGAKIAQLLNDKVND